MADDEVEQLLQALGATPQRIAALCRALPAAQLAAKAEPDEWSAQEILAHLRACADVWGKGIRAMIAQEHPTLRYVSPRTWIKKTNYREEEFYVALQSFSEERAALMATLQALARAEWSRGATFTGTTRGREQTVLSYAQRIAGHEQEHLAQLEALVR